MKMFAPVRVLLVLQPLGAAPFCSGVACRLERLLNSISRSSQQSKGLAGCQDSLRHRNLPYAAVLIGRSQSGPIPYIAALCWLWLCLWRRTIACMPIQQQVSKVITWACAYKPRWHHMAARAISIGR